MVAASKNACTSDKKGACAPFLFPLNDYNWDNLPIGNHPGAFGYIRTNHQHEGVDLYASDGASIHAIRSGRVVDVYQFTGDAVGMPWWHDTWAIAIEDNDGIWVYGEVAVPEIVIGEEVTVGQLIGHIKQVLKVDKGRPMSMLHLERWKSGSTPHTFIWEIDEPQPAFLLDPTPLLLETY